LVGGVKESNMNDISSPGNPGVPVKSQRDERGFTNEEAVKDVSIVAVAGKKKLKKT